VPGEEEPSEKNEVSELDPERKEVGERNCTSLRNDEHSRKPKRKHEETQIHQFRRVRNQSPLGQIH
jgi:hypothetical protein